MGSFDEALTGIEIGVDHADVGLRLVVAATKLEPRPLGSKQRGVVPLQGIIEQTREVRCDLIVRERGRGHHHGNAPQKLPSLVIRPPRLEGTEFGAGHPARVTFGKTCFHRRPPAAPRGGDTAEDMPRAPFSQLTLSSSPHYQWWKSWRSLGESNSCFRRESAALTLHATA
jgi:hypothetical protein